MGEHGQQRGVGLNQDHLERAGVRGLKLLDHSGQPPEERRPHDVGVRGVGSIGKPQALEAREHVAGAERRPVVEGDVLAEGEGPREAVGRDGPPRREAGLELRASPVVADEGVEDLTRDERGRAGERRRGVERSGNARKADPHFAPPIRGTRRDQKRHEPQKGDEEDEPGRAAVAGPHASLIYEEPARDATRFAGRRRHERRSAVRILLHKAGQDGQDMQRQRHPREKTSNITAPILTFFFADAYTANSLVWCRGVTTRDQGRASHAGSTRERDAV